MLGQVMSQTNYRPGEGGGGAFGAPAGGPGGAGGEGGSLEETIPGTPGEDYPIFSVPPETSFLCSGQVDGGYYGDPEAECQAFHICASDGSGGLSKYSFLCPNGTLFNQQYFICDWWFNVDCSLTEELYSLNDEVAAEREANSPPEGGAGDAGIAGNSRSGAGGRGGQGGAQRGPSKSAGLKAASSSSGGSRTTSPGGSKGGSGGYKKGGSKKGASKGGKGGSRKAGGGRRGESASSSGSQASYLAPGGGGSGGVFGDYDSSSADAALSGYGPPGGGAGFDSLSGYTRSARELDYNSDAHELDIGQVIHDLEIDTGAQVVQFSRTK